MKHAPRRRMMTNTPRDTAPAPPTARSNSPSATPSRRRAIVLTIAMWVVAASFTAMLLGKLLGLE